MLQKSENLKDHPIDYSTGVIIVVDNNYSTVVNGEKWVGFHFFEALNDALEAIFFSTGSFLHPIRYSDSMYGHAAQIF